MRRRRFVPAFVPFVLPLFACGSAPPPAPVAPPPPPVPPQVVAAPPPPQGRGPSALLRSHWTFDGPVDLSLYVDVAGLLHAPVFARLVPAMRPLATSQLNAQQQQCLDDALGSAREVLAGQKGEEALTLVAFDEGVAKPTTCLATMGATAATVDGAPDGYRVGDGPIAHLPGLLIMGSEAAVSKAARGVTSPAPLPDLALADAEYLAWTFQQPELGSLHGHLLAGPERFRVGIDADLLEVLAQKVEGEVTAMKGATTIPGYPKEEGALLRGLLGSVTVARDGRKLTVAYDLHGGVDAQTQELGKAISLGIYGVRVYLAQAKAAEARAVLKMIARDHVSAWQSTDPKERAKKKLVSYPPVPAKVPSGAKYSASLADWKAWAPLHFGLDGPLYYQYEVVAAKDGKTAVILAHGDLNGDGKQSLFKLTMHLDPKEHTVVVDADIQETDATE